MRMPAGELTGWMAYEILEPFGERRADLRMGISTAAMLNSRRVRGSRVTKPEDLMPNFDKPFRPKQTQAQMRKIIEEAIGGQHR